MGFMDRIFGQDASPPPNATATGSGVGSSLSADERAIERYRYLLRTAPPDAIEQAHTEAFAQLTPEQRTQVLRGLGHDASSADSSPHALARAATRAELRQPGTLERAFGGGGGGLGMGGMVASSLLGSIAGSFIGTAIAHQLLEGFDDSTWGDPSDVDSGHAEASSLAEDSSFDDGGGFGDSLDL